MSKNDLTIIELLIVRVNLTLNLTLFFNQERGKKNPEKSIYKPRYLCNALSVF